MNNNKTLKQLRQVLLSSGSIAILFLFVKLAGFMEKLVLANYFGTGDDVDAYLVAFSIPFTFSIIFEEILGPVFVPYLVGKFGKGDQQYGIIVLKRFAIGLFSILSVICLFGSFHAQLLIEYLAPGFTGEKQGLAILLTEKIFIILLFLGMTSFLTAIFHSFKKFNPPIIARALEKLFVIIGIIVIHQKMGIMSAVIGCVVGSFFRVFNLFVLLPLKPIQFMKSSNITIDRKETQQLFILMAPLLLGVVFSQVSSLVDNFVASGLGTGAIASLSYARKIIDLPVLVVPFSIGIVLLPYFAELNSPEKHGEFINIFENCFKILFLLFAFITVVVFVFHVPIVKILFERGQFDAASTQIT